MLLVQLKDPQIHACKTRDALPNDQGVLMFWNLLDILPPTLMHVRRAQVQDNDQGYTL